MRYIFILLLFCNLYSVLFAQTVKFNSDSAIIYYSKGKYEEAIKIYEKIISSGYESPEVYYNLANSYYKSNKLSSSILNYERAKILAPNDEDINFNLELARKHVVDKIDVLPSLFIKSWYDRFISSKSTNSWAYISIFIFILFLLLFSGYLFFTTILLRKISFASGVIVLIISVLTFIFSYQQKEAIENHNSAIIFTSTVNVKSSPDDKGTDIFVLHEGTKVIVRDAVDNWKEIKLSDGNIGWIKSSDIVMI